MWSKRFSIAAALAVGVVTALAAAVSAGRENTDAGRGKEPRMVAEERLSDILADAALHLVDANKPVSEEGPRKVVVGTSMYSMWQDYPGLEKRLNELGQLIDQMAERAEQRYPGSGLDLAALPEVAVNGEGAARRIAVPLEGTVLDMMGAKAREHSCYIIVPLYMVEDRDEGRYSNAAVLLGRDGSVVGVYRKVYPAGGLPGESLEGGVMPGNDFPVFQCDFGRVGIQICFDMTFDTGWHTLARKGAELVVWTSQSPGQIRASYRALQSKYYVLTSTWRNNASLLDPCGQLIREIREPARVFVEQIDLSYVLLNWQGTLKNGRAFDERYGDGAGYRYSEAEDGGIFWSNDPEKAILEMVRELGLVLPAEAVENNRKLRDRLAGGRPSTQ